VRIRFQKRYATPDQLDLSNIQSCGPEVCWALGAGQLMKTEDKGRTWKNLYKSPPFHIGTLPHRIAFHSPSEGLLIAKKSPEILFFRTENRGVDWFQTHRSAKGVWGEISLLPQSSKGWCLIKASRQTAFIEIINDKEGQWKRVDTAISGEVCQIVFANELSGWILERWNESSWIEGSPTVPRTTTVLHHSADGGNTWSIISKRECSAHRLIPITPKRLFMVGEEGILVSDDSGRSWSKVLNNPRVPLLDIHFLGTIGATVGTEDLIESDKHVLMMISQDAGKTWVETELPAPEAFFGVRMMTWSSGILASCNAIYTFDLM
jgi:photosystem II stability/assembly factor-like uncharacterized protein